MIRRSAAVAITAVVGVLGLMAGSAGAITFGQPDGNAHPYVGSVVGTVEVSARADEDGRTATPAAVRARGRDTGETVRGTLGAGSDGSRRPDTRTDGGERSRAARADDARTDTRTDTDTDDDAARPGADAASPAARGTR